MAESPATRQFDAGAEDWLRDAYEGDGYVYPTARHRARIVSRVLAESEGPLAIADLGCGGGNLALALAAQGHTVVGVDRSEKMIEIAEKAKESLPPEARGNVRFVVADLKDAGLDDGAFDAVTAMGVIGYLDSDDGLFRIVRSLLKPGGLFVLSSRNRLFNMASPSFRTVREIEEGTAPALLDEMEALCRPVPPEDAARFVERLRRLPALPPGSDAGGGAAADDGDGAEPPAFEPRQHTPKELAKTASAHGFDVKAVYGVHPHLIDPRVCRLLPPGVFNAVSDCLGALEHLPVSLLWSSVFVGVLEKRA